MTTTVSVAFETYLSHLDDAIFDAQKASMFDLRAPLTRIVTDLRNIVANQHQELDELRALVGMVMEVHPEFFPPSLDVEVMATSSHLQRIK